MTDNEELVKRGANDRARGLSPFDCPLFKREQMPATTGESVQEWNAKVDAWNLGWKLEDAVRLR